MDGLMQVIRAARLRLYAASHPENTETLQLELNSEYRDFLHPYSANEIILALTDTMAYSVNQHFHRRPIHKQLTTLKQTISAQTNWSLLEISFDLAREGEHLSVADSIELMNAAASYYATDFYNVSGLVSLLLMHIQVNHDSAKNYGSLDNYRFYVELEQVVTSIEAILKYAPPVTSNVVLANV